MPTPFNRRFVPYRNLDDHFAAPTSDVPASAAWFRQAAHNLSLMTNATHVGTGSTYVSNNIDYEPSLTGPVTGSASGGYMRVGQMCFTWIIALITEASTTEGVTLTLPIPPAPSIVSMHAGSGYAYNGTGSYLPVVAEIQDGIVQPYYTSSTASDGRILQGDPLTFAAGGRLQLYVSYRVGTPPAGYLSDFTYKIDAQVPHA